MAVAPGEHTVWLRYDPPYRGLGIWLSATASLTVAGLVLLDARRAGGATRHRNR
jgi:hypothetical protein